VGDEQETPVLRGQLIDAVCDDLQGIDVQAGVGFVEDGESWFQHSHLQNLGALFLAAGETIIEVAAGKTGVDVVLLHLGIQFAAELAHGHEVAADDTVGVTIRLPAGIAAHVGNGGTQEVGDTDAGNGDGVLEGEEDSRPGAFIGFHIEDAFAVYKYIALRDFVMGMACNHVGKCRFPRTVRSHHCMDFASVQGDVHTFEYFCITDRDVQVLNC